MTNLYMLRKINDLFKYGEQYSSREVSKKLNLTIGRTTKYLQSLNEQHLIEIVPGSDHPRRYVKNGLACHGPTKSRKLPKWVCVDAGFFSWYSSLWIIEELKKEKFERQN